METFIYFIYCLTSEKHKNKPFTIEVSVKKLKLLSYIEINKKWNNHHFKTCMKLLEHRSKEWNTLDCFQINVKNAHPSETPEGSHNQLVKHIHKIKVHAWLNHLWNSCIIMKWKKQIIKCEKMAIIMKTFICFIYCSTCEEHKKQSINYWNKCEPVETFIIYWDIRKSETTNILFKLIWNKLRFMPKIVKDSP
jgi:hypothetical protein